MSKNQRYIRISPPFTLNKYLDNTSNERSSGSFFELKNYIPRDDILRTREGITLFTHTPATTIVIVTYDLTMNISGGSGTITPASGSHTYNDGDVVTITATPSLTYSFSGWTGDVADATASSTTVNMSSNQTVSALFALIANDFSGDANCLCWYKMDTFAGNIFADSKGSNPVTGSQTGVSAFITIDTTNKAAPGLAASIDFDNNVTNSSFGTIAYGDQGTSLPGSVGIDTTFSVIGWYRWGAANDAPSGRPQPLISRWSNTSAARCWRIGIETASNGLRFLLRDTNNTNFTITSDQTTVTGNWYHFKGTYSSATLTATLRVCNSSGTTIFTDNITLTNGLKLTNQAMEIGCANGQSTQVFDGNLQEIVIFNDIVSDAEQDQIIAGTYAP